MTMGDAYGIGPEIICKLFAKGLPHKTVVYGDTNVLKHTANNLGLDNKVSIVEITNPEQCTDDKNIIPVINVGPSAPSAKALGTPNATVGLAAYNYLCKAIDHASNSMLRALVTAPINKHAFNLAGITQPGHTEILAQRTNTPHVAMMLANNELRVILATIHVALAEVPALITKELQIKTIELAHKACQMAGIKKPRIAVAGLNPHAGEQGQFGLEEINIIKPAIEFCKSKGINVTGPWSGDTVFMRARQKEFDIVVAQYHDQGLIPVKYMGLDTGVNVTVGLPFIRTSVDHGTAYDIVGQGIADETSLLHAAKLALEMTSGL